MRIKCAAIRYQGKVYEGESHPRIGSWMVREGICPEPYPSGDDQGFVTECGLYVRREPAMVIALRAKQVRKTIHPRKLFSEDLTGKV